MALLPILILSCHFKSNTNLAKESNENYNLIIDPSQEDSILLSSFIDSLVFVPLETKDNELITQISKIISFNDEFYVLDQAQNSIFIYNNNGKHLKTLHRQGKGPGEYQQLVDFNINKNGLFLLNYPHTILHYNFELEFLRKYEINNLYSFSFYCYNDLFWFSNETGSANAKYHFLVIDKNGKQKNKLIEKKFTEKKFNWREGNEFFEHNATLYFSPLFGNQIYSTDGTTIKKQYTINFENYNFPDDKNLFNENIYSPDFKYAIRQYFWKLNNGLLIDYIHERNRKFALFNQKTKDIKNGFVVNDLIPEYRFFPKWADENKLIEVVDAITIIENFSFLKNKIESLNSLSANNNPVLVLYYLK